MRRGGESGDRDKKYRRHTLHIVYIAYRFERKVIRSYSFAKRFGFSSGLVRLGSVWNGLDLGIGVFNRDFI